MEIKVLKSEQGRYIVSVTGYASYIAGSWADMVVYVMSVLRNV